MLVKQKERETQQAKNKPTASKITFGFPERPKAVTPPAISSIKQAPNMLRQTNRNTLPAQNKNISSLEEKSRNIGFDEIIGMKDVKEILYEAVIIPQKRPDLFEGIRSPPRGILLYGPPGNGKTYITKALAHESGCKFYSISAGSIVNKFVGESEKALRSIFESAK